MKGTKSDVWIRFDSFYFRTHSQENSEFNLKIYRIERIMLTIYPIILWTKKSWMEVKRYAMKNIKLIDKKNHDEQWQNFSRALNLKKWELNVVLSFWRVSKRFVIGYSESSILGNFSTFNCFRTFLLNFIIYLFT